MSEYPYSWKPSSETALDDFLQKCKPSMVVDDGTKPWIWVRRVEHEPLDAVDPKDSTNEEPSIENAREILDQYTEKLVAIQKDDSIPIRANKKKGLRSKKEVREEVMAEAAKKLQEISQESKQTCGKWLFFATPEHIDALFARLARDLVTGALSKTPAFCAKVATTPADVGPNHRYLICLYLPDLYDKAAATEVLRTVCQSTGVRPNSAKPDLYSIIGIDSKHPSGIKSTIWNPADLIPEAELKTLTDTYWADAKKAAAKAQESNDTPTATTDKPEKKTTKLKRKAEESDDDVFDDVKEPASKEGAAMKSKTKDSPPPKVPTTQVSKPASKPIVKPAANDSATESESDDPPAAKAAPAVTKPAKPKVQVDDSDSDEDAVKRPKKVRRF